MLGNESLIAPYLEWAVATRFAYLEGQWFRVLLELNRSASSFWAMVKEMEADDFITVPDIYETAPGSLSEKDITFCMAIMSRKALEALVSEEEPSGQGPSIVPRLTTLAKQIKTIELCTPIEMPQIKGGSSGKPRARSAEGEQAATAASTRHRVVVGVIDDGLAFAHERFRLSNGDTRFKYFFNQDDGSSSAPGPGLELTESGINGLLQQSGPPGSADEDQFYRLARQTLVARRVKHGTHVMDVACGLDPDQVNADSPYLIGVQLPKWVTEETSGTKLTGPAHYAINYIIDRADRIAALEGSAPFPVVINLSYGTIAGPHDGTGPLEHAIDQLIAARAAPLRVVLPAGNHYLARCHSCFELAASSSPSGADKKLRWRIQPDNKALSFMEIWLPELAMDGARPRVEVRLTSPTGERSDWVKPGKVWPALGTNNVRFSVKSVIATARPWILLSVAPTITMMPGTPTAPSGTWLVEIKNKRGAVTTDAWVQRGDTPPGYPLWGRQSRFDDNDYQRFDIAGRPQEEDTGPDPSIRPSYVRRRGSINALATEQRAIVIGGFRRSDYRPSRYSGAGPVATPPKVAPQRTGPDAAAVADDSVALHGILGAGTRSGSVVAMNGTSVAAPQITRLIAQWMGSGLASDRTAVQNFAAVNDTFPSPATPRPNERIGAGRIDQSPRNAERWKRWP